MTDVVRSKCNCPFCGATNDAHSAAFMRNQVPRPGDISICAYCTEAAVFDKDEKGHLLMRKPTAKEWIYITTDREIVQAQIIIANANLSKPKTNE